MAEEHYILMKDASGEKAAGTLKKMVGINSNPKQILRGELLRRIPQPRDIQPRSDGSQSNYSLERDFNITLQAVEDDVSPLSIEDYFLLVAVTSPTDRFRVFSDPQLLEWGENLKVGDQVYVHMPSPNSIEAFAIVRYKGFVKTLYGTIFGVEIQDEHYRGKGTTDGFFQNEQHFKCPPDCGLFVSLDRIRMPTSLQGQVQSQQSSSKQPSYAAVTTPGQSQCQPSRDHKKGSSDVDPPPVRFKVDDHVVVYDRQNTPFHGTVRWAGRKNRMGRDLGELHIGIEMVTSINPTDIPGAKTGLSDIFTTKKNHWIVIPESLVMASEAHTKTRGSREKKNVQQEMEKPPPYTHSPVAIAREYKMTEHEFLAEQQKAYREMESQKKKQDKEKLSHGVKEAIGESISPDLIAQQRELFDEIRKKGNQSETGNARNIGVQQPSPDMNLDVSGKDMKRHHSWQPPMSHVYDVIPALGDRHRILAMQGKSSSVAQGEGIGDSFEHESHQHHRIGVGGDDLERNRESRQYHLNQQAHEHERSHQHSQYQGGLPPSEGGQLPYDGRALYNAPSNQQQPKPVYANIPIQPTTETQGSQVYDVPPDARSNYQEPQSGHSGPVHHLPAQHNIAAGTTGAPQYPAAQHNIAASTAPPGSQALLQIDPNLSIGSRIQIPTPSPTEPFKYGVIRWLGEIPSVHGWVAGIEMDEYMEGCTDGTLTSTGQKFFSCLPGRGIYYPLVNLQPDVRFMDPAAVVGGENIENPLDDTPLTVAEDQFTEGRLEQIQRYIGDKKGIQGHQNSCYLDASIFGLFALTDAFDEMFLQAQSGKTTDQNRQAIAELLWKGIVNPLRKNGVVRFESVMALRTKLDELGKMEGIAHAEKDPEEFLNMLFKYTLKVDPFLTIRRPYGDEPEFFVQLFVEYNESMKLPTIGLLLHSMFNEQKLSFLQMPSKLLIQVPRFGRQFKTYEKIIPDLKLNVSDLTEEYRQAAAQAPRCFVCDARAESMCRECGVEFNKDSCYFCAVCNKRFHSHPSRGGHIPDRNVGCGVVESTLDLLSVICIETSHYVCFTKEPSDDPSKPPKWIFFDSMANRVYDRFNIPSVTECSDVLNQWIYPANGDISRLRNTTPRDLPEYVRRFTQDLYLCVYINLDSVLYG